MVHDADVEILDMTIPIASLDRDGKLDVEMIVKNSRGYIPADQNFDETLSIDYIPSIPRTRRSRRSTTGRAGPGGQAHRL